MYMMRVCIGGNARAAGLSDSVSRRSIRDIARSVACVHLCAGNMFMLFIWALMGKVSGRVLYSVRHSRLERLCFFRLDFRLEVLLYFRDVRVVSFYEIWKLLLYLHNSEGN